MKSKSSSQLKNLVYCLLIFSTVIATAQNSTDTLQGRNLYRPASAKEASEYPELDSQKYTKATAVDTLDPKWQETQDSLAARLRFVQDSLAVRMQFVQDSLLAREIFVRDSLAHRKHILDSLNFLKRELPKLFDASLRTFSDDLIISGSEIQIIGDSMLGNYEYTLLPFALNSEYTPWKSVIPLSGSIKLKLDTIAQKITYIQSSKLTAAYNFMKGSKLLIIEGKSNILNKSGGQLYRVPVDSVSFGTNGEVSTIKRYVRYYEVKANYQRGAQLFIALTQVKQYEYNGSKLSKYKIINFCERTSASSLKKVCNILTYGLSRSGTNYILSRESDPANNFADGTFTYEFDASYTLKSLAFVNRGNSENWKTFVEVNEMGYVSSYIYQNKGWVHQTLLINYYLDDPRAKHKIEKITCIFEDDGVSYFQQNNTTGKSRRRNDLTGEWGPWE